GVLRGVQQGQKARQVRRAQSRALRRFARAAVIALPIAREARAGVDVERGGERPVEIDEARVLQRAAGALRVEAIREDVAAVLHLLEDAGVLLRRARHAGDDLADVYALAADELQRVVELRRQDRAERAL